MSDSADPFADFESPTLVLPRAPGVPEDGIHLGVPFETYLSWDAASHSRLEDCRRSLAYARYRIDHPEADEDTPARLLGTAAHAAILEPDEFPKRYAQRPEGLNLTRKPDKEAYRLYQLSLGYVEDPLTEKMVQGPSSPLILPTDVYADALAIRDSVWVKEWGAKARKILRAAKEKELSAVVTDPETGCVGKARADVPADSLGILADVKTSRDAQAEKFTRAIHTYGIDRQGAWYLRVMRALGRVFESWVVIAVENTAPFEVAVRRMDSESMAASALEIDALLVRYANALRTGRWTGYEEDEPTTGRPEWARPRAPMGEF